MLKAERMVIPAEEGMFGRPCVRVADFSSSTRSTCGVTRCFAGLVFKMHETRLLPVQNQSMLHWLSSHTNMSLPWAIRSSIDKIDLCLEDGCSSLPKTFPPILNVVTSCASQTGFLAPLQESNLSGLARRVLGQRSCALPTARLIS